MLPVSFLPVRVRGAAFVGLDDQDLAAALAAVGAGGKHDCHRGEGNEAQCHYLWQGI